MSDQSAPPNLDQPIELIYRALEDDRYWDDFLECVKDRLRFSAVTLATLYPRHRAYSFSHYVGVSKEDFQKYLDKWAARDPLRKKVLSGSYPLGVLLPTQQIIQDKELMADECWRDFLRPLGLHYGFVALLARDEFQIATVQAGRATHLGPLTPSETEWVQALLPHLMRAVSLHARIARLQTERNALFAHFDSIGTGMVMVTQNGAILLANAPAESILAKDAGLTVQDGRLHAVDAIEQQSLEALILRAGNTLPYEQRKAGTIAISRPGLGRLGPLLVHVTPADSRRQTPGGAGVSDAIVWIIDPLGQTILDLAPLQEIFRLTAHEAMLCQELVHGHSVREIASRWNVSIPTIRTHLAHTLEKTATRRQSELVTLILRVSSIPQSQKR
jgi:DNA-binding CsgD family transcriptional regulator